MYFENEATELIKDHNGIKIDWNYLIPHSLFCSIIRTLPINGYKGEPAGETFDLVRSVQDAFYESNYPEDYVLLEFLGLSNRAYNALCRKGFSTIGDVLRGPRYGTWKDVYNLGKKSRAELEDRMRSIGFKNFSTSRLNNQLGKCFSDLNISYETRNFLIHDHCFEDEEDINHLISLFFRKNIFGQEMMYYLSEDQRNEIKTALEEGCYLNEIIKAQHNIE